MSDTASGGLLISFDIDGTLALGDPPGPVTCDFVQLMRRCGHVIGSASDRTRTEQALVWRDIGLEPDFLGGKQDLTKLRNLFPGKRCIHIGDTLIDAQFALSAEFEFIHSERFLLDVTMILSQAGDSQRSGLNR